MTAWRFAGFEFQPDEGRVLAAGKVVPLRPRTLQVLRVLVESAGRLVTKQRLMERAWPGRVVEENTLAAQVASLRRQLGPRLIATVPGLGYRFVAQVESSAQPPALRSNLPAPLLPLIGRAEDQQKLAELLSSCRLVSVVGSGGVGKTVLAQSVLGAQHGHHQHGACWVELAPLTTAEGLPGAIAQALGPGLHEGSTLDSLGRALSPMKMLLALDNAEHLLAEVGALVRHLLRAAPGLRVLVTSQAPLGLVEEQQFRLAPLQLPPAHWLPAHGLDFGAVELFTTRARALLPDFAVDTLRAPSVVALCRALDGVPLAIELAAARLPLLGLPRLCESLSERLSVLSRGSQAGLPLRQSTLRAAVEWSVGLLEPRELVAFRRLAVVAGSGTLELVQAVLSDADEPPGRGFDTLHALIDRSLVTMVQQASDSLQAPRYRLLESPRALALEGLSASADGAAARERHARALAAQFDRAWQAAWDDRISMDGWTHDLEADLDNAREALAWAVAHDEVDTALRIARTWLLALLRARGSGSGEGARVADACQPLIGAAAAAPPLRLHAMLMMAKCWDDLHPARGRLIVEQALALSRDGPVAGPDGFWRYLALSVAALQYGRQDDVPALRAAVAEMQALEDPSWPPQRLELACPAYFYLARADGNLDAGPRISQRRIALRQAAGLDASVIQGNLVGAELAAGRAESAVQLGEELVERLQSTRQQHALAHARLNLCKALLAVNAIGRAEQLAAAAWPHARQFEQTRQWADCLALLAALQSRPGTAARIAGFSDRIYAAQGQRRQYNEARAHERACALGVAALGPPLFGELRNEGMALVEAEIGSLAFGPLALGGDDR